MSKKSLKKAQAVIAKTEVALVEDNDLAALEAELAAQAQAEAEKEALLKAEEEAKAKAEAEAKAQAEAEAKAQAEEEEAIASFVPGEMKSLIANITPEQAKQKAEEIAAELSARLEFEIATGHVGPSVKRSIENAQRDLTQIGIAQVLAAIDFDASIINRSVSVGKRFNVYALDKIRGLAQALGGKIFTNAFDRAIVKSMLNLKEQGMKDVPGTLIEAACSDKVRLEGSDVKWGKHLARHTVAANTMPTQKSSSLAALSALGIVTSNGMKGKNATYRLTDTPQTRHLADILAA